MDSFEDSKRWEGVLYSTIRDAGVSMGLYENGAEYEKSFDEAIWANVTQSSAGWI